MTCRKSVSIPEFNIPVILKGASIFALFAILAAEFAFGQTPTLLFKSGFESGVYLVPVPSSLASNTFQLLQGTESGTGSTWPMTFWNQDQGSTGLHEIVGGSTPLPTNSYILNTIETVTGHTGAATQALKMEVFQPSPGTCCIQDTLQSAYFGVPVTDVYERFWLKFNPEFLTQVQSNRNNFFRTVWAMKTTNDYRIEAYVYGNSSGQPYWYVHGDNVGGSDTRPPNGTYQEFWAVPNSSVPVPMNQWFQVEIYLHRSSGSDGRFFWAVNGQTLADRYGPNMGVYSDPINLLVWSVVYGDSGNITPAYQWVDDLEIWNRPPCATLPCAASEPSPDSQAPSIPTGLTATAVSSSQINLTWNASSDNLGVTGYRVYRNGSQIATVSGTSYQCTGLNASTTYTHTVAAYDAANNVSSASAPALASTQNPPLPPLSTFTPIRINAGGPAYIDLLARTWSADTGFVGGSTYAVDRTIVNTLTPTVYLSERYGNHKYQFAVPNGTYTVTLKFAEIYWNKKNQRIFNVAINGQYVLTNFDIIARAGGPNIPLDRSFSVTVTGGQIAIQFTNIKDNAKISGIEIR